MAAINAEDVGDASAAVAVAAAGGDLVGALRTVVIAALDVCSAGWAAGGDGLAKKEIENGSDSAGNEDADHPEPGAHVATGGVVTDVADHQHVESGEGSPG